MTTRQQVCTAIRPNPEYLTGRCKNNERAPHGQVRTMGEQDTNTVRSGPNNERTPYEHRTDRSEQRGRTPYEQEQARTTSEHRTDNGRTTKNHRANNVQTPYANPYANNETRPSGNCIWIFLSRAIPSQSTGCQVRSYFLTTVSPRAS